MTKLVDLGTERDARKEKCLFCGQIEHEHGELTCYRVIGVELDPDDGAVIAVRLGPHIAEGGDAA